MQLHHFRTTERPRCKQSVSRTAHRTTEQPIHEWFRVPQWRKYRQFSPQHPWQAIVGPKSVVNEWEMRQRSVIFFLYVGFEVTC